MRRTAFAAAMLATAALTACSSGGDDSAAELIQEVADSIEESAPDNTPELRVGETVEYDSALTTWAVTLGSFEHTDAGTMGENAKMILTVENVGDSADEWPLYGHFTHDSETSAKTPVDVMAFPVDYVELGTNYKPGQSLTGPVFLELPEETGQVTHWHGEFMATAAYVIPLPYTGDNSSEIR